MRIEKFGNSAAFPIFEPGDYVRMKQDEPGPLVTVFAGEWGRVLRVDGRRSVDIRLAGHSRPRTATMQDAIAVSTRYIQPCDHRGWPIDVQQGEIWQPQVRRAR